MKDDLSEQPGGEGGPNAEAQKKGEREKERDRDRVSEGAIYIEEYRHADREGETKKGCKTKKCERKMNSRGTTDRVFHQDC